MVAISVTNFEYQAHLRAGNVHQKMRNGKHFVFLKEAEEFFFPDQIALPRRASKLAKFEQILGTRQTAKTLPFAPVMSSGWATVTESA